MENYPVSAIHLQPTKTPFILRHSRSSKQNTAETICWNILEELPAFKEEKKEKLLSSLFPLCEQIFRRFEMQMQIMERSLKLEKLSKPAANIWENTQGTMIEIRNI